MSDESPALPYFEADQQHWQAFRNNERYADMHSPCQASMRYMTFRDCMTRITNNRLDHLPMPDADN
ncbi:DUF1311 domain-containing protein [Paraburkholderia sprentiae WSM5005]|uniref:DUF1311 domain-containing protein n=1 Tax=Paraburkholderia sprentiae WSM5005 TaxID=754502 RepID=A0A8F4QIN5_9BURK|nr:DUF1311 domain-containing protein [Paraburkholderia sprentiae WSM5005]